MRDLHAELRGTLPVWLLVLALVAVPWYFTRAQTLSGFYGRGGSTTITASLVASYPLTAYGQACPPPCAVYFNADATTHSDGSVNTREDLAYSFDFGDPGKGAWGQGAQPLADRNANCCTPWYSHLYEDDGSYTATVTAMDVTGATGSVQVSITVADPDVVWSGNNTVCVNPNGDNGPTAYDGCPSGALHREIGNGGYEDWDNGYATNTSTSKRVLWKSGLYDQTGGRTNLIGSGGPTMSGCYNASGPGSRSNSCTVSVDMLNAVTINSFVSGTHRNHRLVDHTFTTSAVGESGLMQFGGSCAGPGQTNCTGATVDDIAFVRIAIDGLMSPFQAFGCCTGVTLPRRTFWFDYHVINTQLWGFIAACNDCGIIGGHFEPDIFSHQIRFTGGEGRIVSRNTMEAFTVRPVKSPDTPCSDNIKFHALSDGEANGTGRQGQPAANPSRRWVVSHNVVHIPAPLRTSCSGIDIGPQALSGGLPNQSEEVLYEGIAEYNFLEGQAPTHDVFRIQAYDSVVRGNGWTTGAAPDTTGIEPFLSCGLISTGRCGSGGTFVPFQAGLRVKLIGNTCNDAQSNINSCAEIGSGSVSSQAKNNLIYGPGAGTGDAASDLGTSSTLAGNFRRVSATSPFVDSTPDEFLDLRLDGTNGAAIIDQGTAAAQGVKDALGVTRPVGAAFDPGAFEYVP